MAIVTGTSGDDRYPNELKGTNLADEIFGLAGSDELIGYGGDDVLEGGAGADELFGSAGFDFASYRGSTAAVSVDLILFEGYFGDAGGDQLYGIEGVIGSAFADYLGGDGQRNILRGGGGNDVLEGRRGNDRLEGGGGNDVLHGGLENDELRGGAGIDTASYRDFVGYVVADLAAGSVGSITGVNDRLFDVENVFGTYLADQISGNAAANRLTGYLGVDQLSGRGGADRFAYAQSSESAAAGSPDRIIDFSRSQGDRVDLAAVDANEQASGNQAFTFIGTKAFTGAGQLRFFQQNNDTIVEANTTGVDGAEMRIALDPLVPLRATDFVL